MKMKNAAEARSRGSRTIPIAMIVFALLGVLFGVTSPKTRVIKYNDPLTVQQKSIDKANVGAGFARRMPPKDPADPLGSS
jgi:hypothetical protein